MHKPNRHNMIGIAFGDLNSGASSDIKASLKALEEFISDNDKTAHAVILAHWGWDIRRRLEDLLLDRDGDVRSAAYNVLEGVDKIFDAIASRPSNAKPAIPNQRLSR